MVRHDKSSHDIEKMDLYRRGILAPERCGSGKPGTGGDIPHGKRVKQSIGSARMEEDGTIVLQLRAEGPKGLIGDALLRYPPDHPEYNDILRHLGGLKKGEVKQVPPWPGRNDQKN